MTILRAIDSTNDQLVDALTAGSKNVFYCPSCQQQVILKKGIIKQPHFAHRETCSREMFSEGETREHLLLKRLFATWFYPAQLEAYLPELHQRPDVLVGQKNVLEIQCSKLTTKRFIERTVGYETYDYVPWWILSSSFFRKKKITQMSALSCRYDSSRGLHFWVADVSTEQLSCIYQLKESPILPLAYQKNTWAIEGSETFQEIQQFVSQPVLRELHCDDDYVTRIKRHLLRQLTYKKSSIIKIQEECYVLGRHLLTLPKWVYYESDFYTFFCENIWWYRIVYLQLETLPFLERLTKWQEIIVSKQETAWHYVQIDRFKILRSFFYECAVLAKC